MDNNSIKTLKITDIDDIEIEALWKNAQKDELLEVTMRFPQWYRIKPIKISEKLIGVFDAKEGDPADGFGEPNVILSSFGKLVNVFCGPNEWPEEGEELSFSAVYWSGEPNGNPVNIVFFPPRPQYFQTIDFIKDGLINAFEIKEGTESIDPNLYGETPYVTIRFYGKYKESFAENQKRRGSPRPVES